MVISIRSVVIGRPDRPLQLLTQFGGAFAAAGDVITHVQHPAGPRHGGEQRVEGRDAVGVGRRNRQPFADVVERAFADPPDAGLDRLEGGKQEVPLARAAWPPAAVWASRLWRSPPSQPEVGGPRNASIASRSSSVGSACRRWRSTELSEGNQVSGDRLTVGRSAPARTGSTRMAQALNSAVPDLGSVSSIVRRLVFT